MPEAPIRGQDTIELVCFDLGGVLVRVRESWPAAFEATGLPLPKPFADPNVRNTLAELTRRSLVGGISAEDLMQKAADLAGLTPARAFEISAAWLVEPFPGVENLITRLTATSLRTACLSNTHDHHWQLLTDPDSSDYNWMRRLTHRFASHLIGHAKPHPAAYHHVERETHTPPERILFFDDRPENCQAATDLGWHAHQIDPAANPVSQISAQLRRHGLLAADST